MVWTIYKRVHFLTVSWSKWSSFLGLKNEVACCHSDAISPSELREITFSGTFVWKTISVFIKTTGKLSLWRAEFRRTDWRLGRRTSFKKRSLSDHFGPARPRKLASDSSQSSMYLNLSGQMASLGLVLCVCLSGCVLSVAEIQTDDILEQPAIPVAPGFNTEF